jgi:hypothetical protein
LITQRIIKTHISSGHATAHYPKSSARAVEEKQ